MLTICLIFQRGKKSAKTEIVIYEVSNSLFLTRVTVKEILISSKSDRLGAYRRQDCFTCTTTTMTRRPAGFECGYNTDSGSKETYTTKLIKEKHEEQTPSIQ